jgi:sugar phosphate isomerase/epimerase
VNKIALSPNSLVGVPALEYIDALVKAGYDGIGLRMYASPGVNYEFVTQPIAGNPPLMRDIKQALADSGLILYDILSYYIRPNFDLERMLPSLEFGAELGFPYALGIADDPDWNRQRDNFTRLCEAAEKFGMVVTLEAPVNQKRGQHAAEGAAARCSEWQVQRGDLSGPVSLLARRPLA